MLTMPSFKKSFIVEQFQRNYLKKLRRLLQRKRHVNIKLFVRLSVFYDYSMFVTFYETGEVHFCLFGTNCFDVKAENEKFIAEGLRCRQNLKYENFTSSFGRLRQKKKSCCTCHTLFVAMF